MKVDNSDILDFLKRIMENPDVKPSDQLAAAKFLQELREKQAKQDDRWAVQWKD